MTRQDQSTEGFSSWKGRLQTNLDPTISPHAADEHDWHTSYGCFQKWWYPQIMHFNRGFHYKPSILGYPYFWKHPYIIILNHPIGSVLCLCESIGKATVGGKICIKVSDHPVANSNTWNPSCQVHTQTSQRVKSKVNTICYNQVNYKMVIATYIH